VAFRYRVQQPIQIHQNECATKCNDFTVHLVNSVHSIYLAFPVTVTTLDRCSIKPTNQAIFSRELREISSVSLAI